MKHFTKFSFSFLISLIPVLSFSQETHISPVDRISDSFGFQPSETVLSIPEIHKTKCIPDEVREKVKDSIIQNRKYIQSQNPNSFPEKKGGHPLFILPIQSKSGFDDYGYYATRFQVDHDNAFNNHEDYNCGERTYDWATGDHEGTDYVLWPYPWKYMQEEVMEVIAAAPGVIVDKRDGNYDLNCSNNGNPNWNGVVIEHLDGSQAWYWHFKDGSITSKNIGESVEAGEYLGAAGSSGSSSWPHLHFEIYDGQGNLVDPYVGDCNEMNLTSWWVEQPEYYQPAINHISTHSTSEFVIDCPNPEVTNEAINFEQGDSLFLRLFYRDLEESSVTDLKIFKGINMIAAWSFTNPWGYYDSADAYWYYVIDESWTNGSYIFQAEYAGEFYSTEFTIGSGNTAVEEVAIDLKLYPTPADDMLVIEGFSDYFDEADVKIFDTTGRLAHDLRINGEQPNLSTTLFDDGIYLLHISDEKKIITRRFVVKH